MATTEFRYEPDYAVVPGQTLRSTLGALGMTQADLAARTGLSLKHVNQISQGAAPITPDTALALEKVTGVAARLWNALEARYREQLAREDDRESLARDADWLNELPIAELARRGYLKPRADKTTRVEEICRFFGVADRERWRKVWLNPLASFRQSPSFASDAGAVASWLRIGELEAAEIECEPFDARRFRAVLAEIRTLTTADPGRASEELVKKCAAAGVAVVFVPEIGKTRASGAARWLTPTKAVIQLSLRYKTDDHLWFSFFHEAGHILLHSKKQTFISGLETNDALEEEANDFARTQLIPRRHEPRLGQLRTEGDVLRFAQELGIAPGIVVGRLQKEGVWQWNHGNHLKKRLQLVDAD